MNKIEKIDENSLVDMKNLEVFDLLGNRWKRIESKTFKGLKNIWKLNLSYNQIEEIDENALVDMTNLRKLNLSENKLKRIDERCLEQLESIYDIELQNNQFETRTRYCVTPV